MSILRNLGPALSLFFRQAWKTFERQPKLADFVPEFPLRCQHCDTPIRLDDRDRGAPMFIDEFGFSGCYTGCHVLPHKPMPSVL